MVAVACSVPILKPSVSEVSSGFSLDRENISNDSALGQARQVYEQSIVDHSSRSWTLSLSIFYMAPAD